MEKIISDKSDNRTYAIATPIKNDYKGIKKKVYTQQLYVLIDS